MIRQRRRAFGSASLKKFPHPHLPHRSLHDRALGEWDDARRRARALQLLSNDRSVIAAVGGNVRPSTDLAPTRRPKSTTIRSASCLRYVSRECEGQGGGFTTLVIRCLCSCPKIATTGFSVSGPRASFSPASSMSFVAGSIQTRRLPPNRLIAPASSAGRQIRPQPRPKP